jgi:hypothetical protein
MPDSVPPKDSTLSVLHQERRQSLTNALHHFRLAEKFNDLDAGMRHAAIAVGGIASAIVFIPLAAPFAPKKLAPILKGIPTRVAVSGGIVAVVSALFAVPMDGANIADYYRTRARMHQRSGAEFNIVSRKADNLLIRLAEGEPAPVIRAELGNLRNARDEAERMAIYKPPIVNHAWARRKAMTELDKIDVSRAETWPCFFKNE